VLAILIAAAEEGAEPSKTPFYICGGLLALWAVLVAAAGIRAHDRFPASRRVSRGVIAVSALLIVAAMASAVITA